MAEIEQLIREHNSVEPANVETAARIAIEEIEFDEKISDFVFGSKLLEALTKRKLTYSNNMDYPEFIGKVFEIWKKHYK